MGSRNTTVARIAKAEGCRIAYGKGLCFQTTISVHLVTSCLLGNSGLSIFSFLVHLADWHRPPPTCNRADSNLNSTLLIYRGLELSFFSKTIICAFPFFLTLDLCQCEMQAAATACHWAVNVVQHPASWILTDGDNDENENVVAGPVPGD